jgi:hypothetical protein
MSTAHHEDIGWPTAKQEAALNKAAKAAAPALAGQTQADKDELVRRCEAAAAYRRANADQSRPQAD